MDCRNFLTIQNTVENLHFINRPHEAVRGTRAVTFPPNGDRAF